MKNKSYLTAITRKKPSLPMETIYDRCGLDRYELRSLDYGCGKGFDADYYGMEKYDPFYFPKKPIGRFDIITCNYVLNVVTEREGKKILKTIKSLLNGDGVAFISVRRDMFMEGFTSRGTYQRYVELELPVFHLKRGAFIIYKMEGV